jgi:hypothetical protein
MWSNIPTITPTIPTNPLSALTGLFALVLIGFILGASG